MALDLDSEKFQSCFRTSDRSSGMLFMVRAIHSAGLSIYYIHRITSAKRMREVRSSLLIRDTYSLNFESQKGSIEALNFLIITS